MKINCLAIVTNGSEDSELITCTDLIKRSGGTFSYCALDEIEVTLSHGTKIVCDFKFDPNNKYEEYNLLYLPGGAKGVNRFYESKELFNLINEFHNSKRFVSAICAAPTVLSKAGIMKNHKFTCYDGWEAKSDDLVNYVPKANVIVDNNVITGRSVNYVIEFTLSIIEVISGKEIRIQTEKQILMN